MSGQILLCNLTSSLTSFINFFRALSDSTGISNTRRPHWRSAFSFLEVVTRRVVFTGSEFESDLELLAVG